MQDPEKAATTLYKLSFTATSLRPELARITAETYMHCGIWESVQEQVLEKNLFQCRSRSSLIRMEREIRQRLKCLTKGQIRLLAEGSFADRISMAWLAVIKQTVFVRDFVVEVMRGKMADMDTVLRLSDFNNFIMAKTPTHPELQTLKESSLNKIRQVLFNMLAEAGLAATDKGHMKIVRPQLSRQTTEIVVEDCPRLLAGFLWTDTEITKIRNRS